MTILTFPLCYEMFAAPLRSSNFKSRKFIETLTVDIPDHGEDRARVSAIWTGRDGTRSHTRFVNGRHWIGTADIDSQALLTLQDRNASLPALCAAYLKLEFVFGRPNNAQRSIFTEAAGLLGTDEKTGSGIVFGRKLDALVSDEHGDKVRQRSFLNARLKAHDLMFCDGMLYVGCPEPTLQVVRTTENRPPDTISLEIGAHRGNRTNRHESLPLYEHRLDRLGDFKDFIGDNPFDPELDFEDNIGEVVFTDSDFLSFDAEGACIRAALVQLQEEIAKIDMSLVSDEAIKLYAEVKVELLVNEAVVHLLERSLERDTPLLQGSVNAASVRDIVAKAMDRWSMRPLGMTYTG